MSNKTIHNVVFTEIDRGGAFLFTWNDPHPTIGNSVWLAGWNRPSYLNIGAVGYLEYRISQSYGLWFFTPYKCNCSGQFKKVYRPYRDAEDRCKWGYFVECEKCHFVKSQLEDK